MTCLCNRRKGGSGKRGGNRKSKGSGKTTGGYRATARDRYYLKRYRQGKSIGFTMRSSLKAKGLIPRSNGTKRVSPKYRGGL